jgi:hypothetical protein
MLTEQFQIAAGSVTGRDHAFSHKPNQDALFRAERPDLLVGVVCDGCGDPESPHSEVGARLGARLIGGSLLTVPTIHRVWLERARGAMLSIVRDVARCMMGMTPVSYTEDVSSTIASVVRDYFLFTIVGFAITPETSYFFSIGDGTLYVNGERIPLGPFPDNAPPYAAYALLNSSLLKRDPGALWFKICKQLPTAELESFLIGSDGVGEIEQRAGELMPGGKEYLGPVSQFWMDDRYFTNPALVGRKLALANAEKQHIDWERRTVQKRSPLLHDDSTLICGRRKS